MTQDVHSRNFFLKAFPRPEFIPNIFDVVGYSGSDMHVLVVTVPKDPDEIAVDDMATMETRPVVCDILVGEDLIKNVDVSQLRPIL